MTFRRLMARSSLSRGADVHPEPALAQPRRRRLLVGAFAAACQPRLARAQAAALPARVGWLSTADLSREPHYVAFVQRLADLGFVEGRNLDLERRDARNRIERLPALAAELKALGCSVLFAGGTEANLAALLKAGGEVPIVFVAVDFDPVAAGYVTNLAHPGGRVTGITALQSVLPAKRLQLLEELLPRVRVVAVLTNEEAAGQLAVVEKTARELGLQLRVLDLKRPPFDYEAAYAEAIRARAEALVVLGSGLWVPARRRIVDLALAARLPTVFHQFDWVAAGGLMSYGFSFPSLWRRGAELVAALLRGARVGDIPMEQPTTYELAINLVTAHRLGVEVPTSML